jgi:hypothetical protein
MNANPHDFVTSTLTRTPHHTLLSTMPREKSSGFFSNIFCRRKRLSQPTTDSTTVVATNAETAAGKLIDKSYSENDVTLHESNISTPREPQSCSSSASATIQRSKSDGDTIGVMATAVKNATEDPGGQAYELAKLQLTDKELQLLPEPNPVDGPTSPISRTVVGEATEAHDKRQRYQRKRFHKIVKGLDTYARIVDVAIQHNPDITALVWAGARFLLQVRKFVLAWPIEGTNSPFRRSISITKRTWKNWKRLWKVLSRLWLGASFTKLSIGEWVMSLRSSTTIDALSISLQESLPQFYCSVIVFTIKARRYFSPESAIGQLKSFQYADTRGSLVSSANMIFGYVGKAKNALLPFETSLDPYIKAISAREQLVKEAAGMASMERIKDEIGQVYLSNVSNTC